MASLKYEFQVQARWLVYRYTQYFCFRDTRSVISIMIVFECVVETLSPVHKKRPRSPVSFLIRYQLFGGTSPGSCEPAVQGLSTRVRGKAQQPALCLTSIASHVANDESVVRWQRVDIDTNAFLWLSRIQSAKVQRLHHTQRLLRGFHGSADYRLDA